ncbi:hypothetical protein [Krasilnikovia sp. MM14-A1259]|uniref:alpha/beta hydrolase family protein n=1 Tax=Krasilnikovia sp. MM14-A1259 TaxID=3373539 RepID=UPI00399D234C
MVLTVPAAAWAAEWSLSRPLRPPAAVRDPAPHAGTPGASSAAEPRYPVGMRTLMLSRGDDRPLRTLLFYPASAVQSLVPASAPDRPGSTTVGMPSPIPPPPPDIVPAGPPTPHTPIDQLSPASTTGSRMWPGPTRPGGSAGPADPTRPATPVDVAAIDPTVSSRSGSANGAGSTSRDASRRTPCPETPLDYGTVTPARPGAAPAAGRFPLVLFSHGLSGTPERYAPLAATWAATGFVVAVPAYPHTCAGAPRFRRSDIVHQPADAEYVIQQIRRLERRRDDPLYGRIDRDRVAAVGHSAGGYTTTGLFTAGHPRWLRSGVVIAGWQAPGSFAGPAATMLFLQGESDHVVPLALGRAAFDAVPWPKSYVLLPRAHHAGYMLPGRYGWAQMNAIVTDFLHRTLGGDQGARWRPPAGGFPAADLIPDGPAPPTSEAERPATGTPRPGTGTRGSGTGTPGGGSGTFRRPFTDRP